MFTKHV